MENVFRIVLQFQLLESVLFFFCLFALWKDSIFGQSLVNVVNPGFHSVVGVRAVYCRNNTNPVPGAESNKHCHFKKANVRIGEISAALSRPVYLPRWGTPI